MKRDVVITIVVLTALASGAIGYALGRNGETEAPSGPVAIDQEASQQSRALQACGTVLKQARKLTLAHRAYVLNLYDDAERWVVEGIQLGRANNKDEANGLMHLVGDQEASFRASSQITGDPIKSWATDDAVDQCERGA